MDDKKNNLVKINEDLVKIFDHLLASDEWEASSVLKLSAKKISGLRDQAVQLLAQATEELPQADDTIKMIEDKEGFTALYVLIYQTKGLSLDKWHGRVVSLAQHQVGLPIYRDENTVKKILRNKDNRNNYGYVEVLVEESKIFSSSSWQKDAEGYDLVALHANAILADHIRWFCDGRKYYAFAANSELQLINDMTK